jgi:hypothetical protein
MIMSVLLMYGYRTLMNPMIVRRSMQQATEDDIERNYLFERFLPLTTPQPRAGSSDRAGKCIGPSINMRGSAWWRVISYILSVCSEM